MHLMQKYSLDNFPGIYSRRVFVAGPYREPYKIRLSQISETVRACGFTPINADEFGIPLGAERNYCELLLAQCRLAIFEVSIEAGWMSEYEIAYSLRKICLSLWEKKQWEKMKISRMIRTHEQFVGNNVGYITTRDLQDAVFRFLAENSQFELA